MNQTVGLLLLLPLLGFIVNFFFGKKTPKSLVGMIGSGTILASFILSLTLFSQAMANPNFSLEVSFWDWISVNDATLPFNIPFSFLIDRLSVFMLMIITGVGFLIHVYSIGYMHEDKGYFRFFAYLNLFVFFMQILVTGGNYIILFIGWEGVGLCSYLLIGFWYKNQNYNDAAKKAFIMNRVGDLGFLIGVFWIFNTFKTIQFTEVFKIADATWLAQSNFNDPSIVFITILLFIGATGKSAQIPLFTWLPDAMAGPTPVSALIHAATMVTAGIYLIVRSHVLFYLAPYTSEIITWVGMATAIFAGTIGLAQNDIKKVLAYSTVSQLGLMFMALGMGAYTTAMFHLATHAFFKALLFLGSGSVIHAMSGEQDIRMMGGLRKKLPVTHITFLIGTLAITGIFPFAGFFSKDEILAVAFEHNKLIWGLGLLASLITAVYMFRLYFLTFSGSFRGTEHQKSHLHESPAVMTMPLVVLAILSTIGGFMGIPKNFGSHVLKGWFGNLLADVTSNMKHAEHESVWTEISLMAGTMGAVLIIMLLCVRYFTKKEAMSMDDEALTGPTRWMNRKWYVDELYDTIIVKPVMNLSEFWRFVDTTVVDGIVNGVARLTDISGRYVRLIQTGNIGFYVFAMVISIILMLGLVLLNSTQHFIEIF